MKIKDFQNRDEIRKRKLYIEPEDAFVAKTERYVYLVATVICLGIGGALAILAIDLIRGTSLVGGIIVAVPSLVSIVCGIVSWVVKDKYKADQMKMERREREFKQASEAMQSQEDKAKNA